MVEKQKNETKCEIEERHKDIKKSINEKYKEDKKKFKTESYDELVKLEKKQKIEREKLDGKQEMDREELEKKQNKNREELKKKKKKDIKVNRAIELLEINIETTTYPIKDLFFMYGVEYGKMLVEDKTKKKEIVKIEVEKFFNQIDKEIEDKENCKEKMSEGIAYSDLLEISDGSFIVKPIHYIVNIMISVSPILIFFKDKYPLISLLGLFFSLITIIAVFYKIRIIQIHKKWGEIIYKAGTVALLIIVIIDFIDILK